jgi:hypothetical protein
MGIRDLVTSKEGSEVSPIMNRKFKLSDHEGFFKEGVPGL